MVVTGHAYYCRTAVKETRVAAGVEGPEGFLTSSRCAAPSSAGQVIEHVGHSTFN